ncbi:MAG: hypothetical protein ACRD8W_08260, partial [Nitrososphaeraceae archaeon]
CSETHSLFLYNTTGQSWYAAAPVNMAQNKPSNINHHQRIICYNGTLVLRTLKPISLHIFQIS